MANNEDLEKLEGVLKGFADLIREGEGTDQPVAVSSMREKIAAIDMAKFTVDENGLLKGYTVKSGSEDPSEPATDLEYFEKLMANFADKVRTGSEKLDVDGIKAQADLSCGIHKDDAGLYTLRLPDGVTDLDSKSFGPTYNTSERQKIGGVFNLPDNLTEIKGVFNNCRNIDVRQLASELPDTVTSIGNFAFYRCGVDRPASEAASFTVPSAVTSIGDSAFQGANISDISLPSGLQRLGNYALDGIHVTDLVLPDSVTNIAFKAIRIPTLETLVLPSQLSDFSSNALGSYEDYQSRSNLRSISMNGDGPNYKVRNNCLLKQTDAGVMTVIAGCLSSTFDQADNIGRLGACSFCNTGLTSLQIPASVTEIGDYAFYRCKDLETVSFLGGAVQIGNEAFFGAKVSTLTMNCEVQYIGSAAFVGCEFETLSFSVPSDDYCTLNTRGNSGGIFPSGLKRLNSDTDGVFNMTHMDLKQFNFNVGNDQVTTLNLSDVKLTLNAYSYQAFSTCDSLESLSITDSYAYNSVDDSYLLTVEGLCAVATIDGHKTVVCGCSNSQIPDYAEVISNCAFAGAQNLGSANLRRARKIGYAAFRGTGLTSLTIGSNIEEIESEAFTGCSFEEYDESSPDIDIYYDGSFEDLESDDSYKYNVLSSLSSSCGYAYARVYEYNGSGDSEVKRISQWYGGGSGSGY